MDKLPKMEVRIKLYDDSPGRPTVLLGFAELTIADAFVIKGIRILAKSGDMEPFIVFPAERGRGRDMDRWYDIAHAINSEARAAAITSIMEAYENTRRKAADRP